MTIELKTKMLEFEVFHSIVRFIHNLEILATLLRRSQIKDLAQKILTENICGACNFFGNY